MSKKYSIFITALFSIFIVGFGAALFILPDRDFSEQENRYLAQLKAPTFDTLKSGKFMKNFEDYVIDQFPLRDQWIHLKAESERLLGKLENNSVYLGTDGGQTLFAQFTPLTAEELAQRIAFINKLAENVEVPVAFALIPDKSYVWADRLPANAPLVDDGSTIAQAGQLCSDKVQFIDMLDALSGDDVFYRTDHHWTTFGAYQGYLALQSALTGSAGQLDTATPQLMSEIFYGTTYSSAGAGWVKPDSIFTMIPEGGLTGNTTVTSYHNGTPEEGTLYDLSFLEKKDKYSMFLGGNQPLCVVTNPDAENGKLLVIRDSYSDSLAPFLSMDWQEVHLFDLRYNRTSLKTYIAENGIDQVLVLYSNANFATDANLFLLGL